MLTEAPTQPIHTVNIRPGVSVLSVLRHLNYKAWFALAEFVDNSVQSFLSNADALKALHGDEFRLKVQISIDPTSPARISIRDNAAGIRLADFPRAFRPAAVPPDRSGLSEFGMGMKSAACWFSPRWSVRTKALDDPFERLVRFDVDRIVNDQIEELEITSRKVDADWHYTEVILEDLYHVPVKKTVGKIKEHLADIYRVFIREGSQRSAMPCQSASRRSNLHLTWPAYLNSMHGCVQAIARTSAHLSPTKVSRSYRENDQRVLLR